jgi:hypothetical protein
MDLSGLAPLVTIGNGGLVTLFVVLMFLGRIVPGRERDYWREAFQEEQRHTTKLMQAIEVTGHVLTTVDNEVAKRGERR